MDFQNPKMFGICFTQIITMKYQKLKEINVSNCQYLTEIGSEEDQLNIWVN